MVAHFPVVIVGAGIAGRAAVSAFDAAPNATGRVLLLSHSVPPAPDEVLARVQRSRPLAQVDDDLFHPQAPVDAESRWRQCVRREIHPNWESGT